MVLRSRLAPFALMLSLQAPALNAEGFLAPRSGSLFLKAAGGSEGRSLYNGRSQFGLGTSQGNFVPLLTDLPLNPSPSGEVFAGFVNAGQTVHFGMYTVIVHGLGTDTGYAFSSGTDPASQSTFGDTDNSLGMGGSIIEQTGPNTWLLHLDDATSYQFNDDDNDVRVEIRLQADSGDEPTGDFPRKVLDFEPPLPTGLTAMSFIQGTAVPVGAVITDEYASHGVLIQNAALINLGTGHAPSGSNGIGPISPLGTLDYASPITFTFVSPTDGVSPVATDYFSISTDTAGGSRNTVTVRAYSADNRLVGSVSHTETGGSVAIRLEGIGEFHKVVVQSTLASQATGGIGFDLLKFGSLPSSTPPQPPLPAVTAAGIVSAASLEPGLVPGGLVSVFGTGLSTGIVGTELPGGETAHKGTVVLIGGWPAPLLSVTNLNGQEQINLQVPFELVPGTSTTVQVVNNGQRTSVDGVPVYAAKPGIFEVPLGPGGLPLGAVIHPNGSIVTTANAAWRGEVVALFLTGLGGLAPYVETGEVGPVPPPTTQMPVTVLVDNSPARVLFSGYAPGFVGLYQVNFEIPQALGFGLVRSLIVSAGGNASQESFLPVQ